MKEKRKDLTGRAGICYLIKTAGEIKKTRIFKWRKKFGEKGKSYGKRRIKFRKKRGAARCQDYRK